MKTKLFLFGLSICLQYFNPAFSQNAEVKIEGRVLDDKGAPIVRCVVEDSLNGVGVMTDDKGYYTFKLTKKPVVYLKYSHVSHLGVTLKLQEKELSKAAFPGIVVLQPNPSKIKREVIVEKGVQK